MQQIVSEVKAQYADVSSRSRQDAEAWYQTKVRTQKNTLSLSLSTTHTHTHTHIHIHTQAHTQYC